MCVIFWDPWDANFLFCLIVLPTIDITHSKTCLDMRSGLHLICWMHLQCEWKEMVAPNLFNKCAVFGALLPSCNNYFNKKRFISTLKNTPNKWWQHKCHPFGWWKLVHQKVKTNKPMPRPISKVQELDMSKQMWFGWRNSGKDQQQAQAHRTEIIKGVLGAIQNAKFLELQIVKEQIQWELKWR